MNFITGLRVKYYLFLYQENPRRKARFSLVFLPSYNLCLSVCGHASDHRLVMVVLEFARCTSWMVNLKEEIYIINVQYMPVRDTMCPHKV